ncbi:FhaA domain-containing protein [Thermophilibacter sp.]
MSDFEARIGSVFGAAPQGYTEPFSFKKLAKRAAREMENETFEIDGVDTAPALYTVLVSATDDSLMRPLYEQITYETASFVTAQAQKRGYAFVGEPLVRFMVDPGLKSGKFAVFAENVDAGTLARLREEERAFLAGNSSAGGAAAQVHPRSRRSAAPAQAPAPAPIPAPVEPELVPLTVPSVPEEPNGLDVMPSDLAEPMPVAAASESTPMPLPLADPAAVVAPAGPGAVPVPQTQRRNVPLVNPRAAQPAHVAAQPAHAAARAASCLLIDRQTGRTYTAQAPSTVIGRERSQAGVVLRDPNVSRRHAELSFDGRDWRITDLGSTNGTLVNDVDVRDCILRDGDLITLGLVNLEFRENPR